MRELSGTGRSVAVYRSTPRDPNHAVRLAGRFRLDDAEGRVVLEVFDEESRERLERLGTGGVGSGRLERMVKPSEGALFLDSLVEQDANSSYWHAVEESDRDRQRPEMAE